MENQTVEISVERFEELAKKEYLLDKLMDGKNVSIYLFNEIEEKEL